MKKIIALAFLALSSCHIPYDGETRLVFQARLVDSQGHPKTNFPVAIDINDGEMSDVIANGNTNHNGELTLIFPAPSNLDAKINVNIGDEQLFGPTMYGFLRSDFNQYKLDVNPYVVYNADEIVQLYITYENTTGNQLSAIRIESAAGHEWFYENQFGESMLEYQTYFNVVKNSNVEIVYTIGNQEMSVPLSIGDANVNYTLNY